MNCSTTANPNSHLCFCWSACRVFASSSEEPPPKVVRQESLLKVAAKDCCAVARPLGRVQPDRRLLAVGALYQLSTGKPGCRQATFDRDHWNVLGTQSVDAA